MPEDQLLKLASGLHTHVHPTHTYTRTPTHSHKSEKEKEEGNTTYIQELSVSVTSQAMPLWESLSSQLIGSFGEERHSEGRRPLSPNGSNLDFNSASHGQAATLLPGALGL